MFKPVMALMGACILSFVFATILPGTASACVCFSIPTVPEAFEDSGRVFEAQVLEVDTSSGDSLARARILKDWKGSSKQTVTIEFNSYGCGPSLREGESYLIFANQGLFRLNAIGCSRTTTLPYDERTRVQLSNARKRAWNASALNGLIFFGLLGVMVLVVVVVRGEVKSKAKSEGEG